MRCKCCVASRIRGCCCCAAHLPSTTHRSPISATCTPRTHRSTEEESMPRHAGCSRSGGCSTKRVQRAHLQLALVNRLRLSRRGRQQVAALAAVAHDDVPGAREGHAQRKRSSQHTVGRRASGRGKRALLRLAARGLVALHHNQRVLRAVSARRGAQRQRVGETVSAHAKSEQVRVINTHSEGRSTSVMPASSFRNARDDVAAVSCAFAKRRSKGQPTTAKSQTAWCAGARAWMVDTMEHELASRKVPGSISRCSCVVRRWRRNVSQNVDARWEQRRFQCAPCGQSRWRTPRSCRARARPPPPGPCSATHAHTRARREHTHACTCRTRERITHLLICHAPHFVAAAQVERGHVRELAAQVDGHAAHLYHGKKRRRAQKQRTRAVNVQPCCVTMRARARTRCHTAASEPEPMCVWMRTTLSLCLATISCTFGSSSNQMPKLLSGPPTFVLPVPPLPSPGLKRTPTELPGKAAPYASSWCRLRAREVARERCASAVCVLLLQPAPFPFPRARACTRSASRPP
jgi:hypothetical protein